MDNIPLFADRKNGRVIIEYPHPLLETILSETYGIIVYQEQVMQAAQVLAGYSLGEADLLRRAMGKKIQKEMDDQRARFVTGCAANDIAPPKANELFDLIDKFAGYGFNKSHAAAYAVLSYQTAWVKTHYPQDFFAASMAYDLSNTDKLAIFADDMRRMNVRSLAPCINASGADFTVESDDEGLVVRFALGALKGVGEGAMEQICQERAENGPFKDLDDLAHRINPRLINRRQLESLAGGGAFDALTLNRAGAFAVAENILAVANSAEHSRTSGQGGLFGGEVETMAAIQIPAAANWTLSERMTAEKEAFGFYFSAHPADRYSHVAASQGARSYAALCTQPAPSDGSRTTAVMSALVEDVKYRTSARGRRYLMATMSDATGQFVATCFDDDVSKNIEESARKGGCALLTVELDRKPGEETPRITIRRIQPLEGVAGSARLKAEVRVHDIAGIAALASILTVSRGGRSEVFVTATLPEGGEAQLLLGRDFLIDGELADKIGALDGIDAINLTQATSPKLALVS
jgi:DNA polymerase-3 subunit alpha